MKKLNHFIIPYFGYPGSLIKFHCALFFLLLSSFRLEAQTIYTSHEFDFPGETCDQVQHCETYDGGTIFCARTMDLQGDYFINFVKFSNTGGIQWKKRMGPSFFDFSCIVQCPDSGYVVAGMDFLYFNCIKIIKLDKNGGLVYCRNNFLNNYNTGSQTFILPRNNNNVYVTTNLMDTVTMNLSWQLWEFDAGGNLLWTQAYHQIIIKTSVWDIDTCSNGDILLLGSWFNITSSLHGPKIDRIAPGGQLLWSRYYENNNADLYPVSFLRMPGDFIYVANSYYDMNVFQEGIGYMKIDGAGNVIWSYSYLADDAYPSTGIRGGNSETCIAGTNSFRGWLARFDSTGTVLCSNAILNTGWIHSISKLNTNDFTLFAVNTASRIVRTTTGPCGASCVDSAFPLIGAPLNLSIGTDSIQFIPTVTQQSESPVLFVPTLHFTEECSGVGVDEAEGLSLMIYPSPASEFIRIVSPVDIQTVEIRDVAGQALSVVNTSGNVFNADMSAYPNGIYIVSVFSEQGTVARKILIAR